MSHPTNQITNWFDNLSPVREDDKALYDAWSQQVTQVQHLETVCLARALVGVKANMQDETNRKKMTCQVNVSSNEDKEKDIN